jgi:hypothetical protein
MHSILAGNPGPQTSPVTAIVVVGVLVLVVGGAFGLAALAGSSWHKSQADARQEAHAGDVTASWPVEMRREGFFVFHGAGLQGGRVSLRGGFIEVAHTWPVARALNRGEFYFPARETRLWVESGVFGRERLVISGSSGGQPARVSVSPGSRAVLEQMWNALAEAGAIPAS